jgi:exodeoxyribonuclease-5
MKLSPQQTQAYDDVGRWLREDSPVYRLFGYAGTGKTVLAKKFAESFSGPIHFAAYTGKAAHVLRKAGCHNASTLHSLIYRVREKSRHRLEELRKAVALAPEGPGRDRLIITLKAEEEELKKPRFELNPDSPLGPDSLLVVDECSMVDERLGADVLSFGAKVLVLGDPAQLPPVRGGGYFTGAEPDSLLTEIHRQAQGSPVLRLATEARRGRLPALGNYGSSVVLSRKDFCLEDYGLDYQVITGRNATRRRGNAKARELRGFSQELPVPGDRLVCLRNDHEAGLLNGAIWEAVRASESFGDMIALTIQEEDSGLELSTVAHAGPFLGEDVPYWAKRDAHEFEYGYCLTAHKAQGSQWPAVIVVDESSCFRADRWRWLYTSLTRAVDKVVLVRT